MSTAIFKKKRYRRLYRLMVMPIVASCLSFGLASLSQAAEATQLPRPLIIKPVVGEVIKTGMPVIAGVTINNAKVEVWIDGKRSGIARVTNHPSDIAVFQYQPKALRVDGHTVIARAISSDGKRKSADSDTVSFIVKRISAPVIFSQQQSGALSFDHPARVLITGVVRNGLSVDIKVDGKKIATSTPKKSKSGTASFGFRPKVAPGEHAVVAVARDSNGRISIDSDPVLLRVSKPVSVPVMLKQAITGKKVAISGNVAQGAMVEVWVDGKLSAEIQSSAKGKFNYTTEKLKNGAHWLQLVARDQAGNRSLKTAKKWVSVGITATAKQKEATSQTPASVKSPVTNEPKSIPDLGKVEGKTLSKPQPEDGEKEKEATPKEDQIQPAPVEKSGEGVADQGDVTTNEPESVEVSGTNWPLIVGIVILLLLVIIFVIWYAQQKKDMINKSIDRIFGEDGEEKKQEKQEAVNVKAVPADSMEAELKKEDKKTVSGTIIPPPPPPPPPPPSA